MIQIEEDHLVSLSLLAKNWAETKEQSDHRSAQSSASCRRSGRSPALPYPPHECPQCTTLFFPPFKGDISTLQKKGHFYFALTEPDLTEPDLVFRHFFGRSTPLAGASPAQKLGPHPSE